MHYLIRQLSKTLFRQEMISRTSCAGAKGQSPRPPVSAIASAGRAGFGSPPSSGGLLKKQFELPELKLLIDFVFHAAPRSSALFASTRRRISSS
jgi:hypothetical protein